MLYTFLQSVLTLPLMCILMCSMLELRYPLKKSIPAMVAVVAVITVIDVFLSYKGFPYALLVNFYYLTSTVPTLLCFYILSRNRSFYFLFAYCTECIFAIISNALAAIIGYLITGTDTYLTLFIRILILSVMIWVVRRFIREPFLFVAERKKGWLLYTTFPLLLILMQTFYTFRPAPDIKTDMVLLPYLSWIYPTELAYVVPAILAIIVGYVFVGNAFRSSMLLHEEQQEKHDFQLQAASLASQCETYENAQEKFREIRHDMRHHITIVSSLIGDGHTDQVLDYLSSMGRTFEETRVKQYCLNPVVNSILSVYAETAEKEKIDFHFEVNFPPGAPIDYLDLGVVLSNALENAVHACCLVPEGARRLSLLFKYYGDKLIFEVRNTYTGAIQFDQYGLPVTDKSEHGIGSRSIAAFAKKYHSTLDCMTEDGYFILRILVDNLFTPPLYNLKSLFRMPHLIFQAPAPEGAFFSSFF